MTSIMISNQKGGVAKTTTSVNIAAGIKLLNPKASVLLIEGDGQGSIRTYFKLRQSDTTVTFADFLIGGKQIAPDNTLKVEVAPGMTIDILLASKVLNDADAKMAAFTRREETLRLRYKTLSYKWDYVIIDCPGALNVVTQNAMAFSDYILVPATMDAFSAATVQAALGQVKIANEIFERDLKVLGVLPTIYDQRNAISKDTLDTIKKLDVHVFEPIGIDSLIKTSQVRQKPVYAYLGRSRAATQYINLVSTIMEVATGKKWPVPEGLSFTISHGHKRGRKPSNPILRMSDEAAGNA